MWYIKWKVFACRIQMWKKKKHWSCLLLNICTLMVKNMIFYSFFLQKQLHICHKWKYKHLLNHHIIQQTQTYIMKRTTLNYICICSNFKEDMYLLTIEDTLRQQPSYWNDVCSGRIGIIRMPFLLHS